MCCRFTKIVVVMARLLMYSVSMILCLDNIIPTPCLLSNFPDPMKMCVLVSTFHSIELRPICSLRARLPFLRFFHSSALTSYFLQYNECNFFCFFVSSSLFPVERPLAILFMTQCFVLLSVLLPLSFSSRFFPLLLLSSLLSFSVFPQTQRNISINGAMLESSSSFSSQVFHFLFRLHYCSTFSHACWKTTVNFHELVPASSFTSASFVTVISL